MKKRISISVMLIVSCLAISSITNAQSTSCTIYLSGQSGHGYTYEVRFYVHDYAYGTFQGPSAWVSINVGTNSNVTIPYGVVPDCVDRWIIQAEARELLYGAPTGSPQTQYTGLLDSDEYYSGPHVFYFSF